MSKKGDIVTAFRAAVQQNAYLPRGTSVVHAIVSISAGGAEASSAGPAQARARVGEAGAEVLIVDCSGSMARPPEKVEAARLATCRAVDRLPEGTAFAIVAGTSFARMVYPPPPGGPGDEDAGV